MKINRIKLETIGGMVAAGLIGVFMASAFWIFTYIFIYYAMHADIGWYDLASIGVLDGVTLLMTVIAYCGFDEMRDELKGDYAWCHQPIIGWAK